VDYRWQQLKGSPEFGLAATPVGGSSPRVGGKGEELRGVVTEGGVGRWTAGGEPATVGNKWVKTELDGRVIRVQMERADARNGNVVWRRCSRVPFIGRRW
jgi:hypothetical protein